MANDALRADDISALWGPAEEGAFQSGRAVTADRGVQREAPFDGMGDVGRADPAPADSQTAPAEALAAFEPGVVTRADLDNVRAEVEGAFTDQIAGALYKLLAVSNDRFTSAEQHSAAPERRVENIS